MCEREIDEDTILGLALDTKVPKEICGELRERKHVIRRGNDRLRKNRVHSSGTRRTIDSPLGDNMITARRFPRDAEPLSIVSNRLTTLNISG